MTTSLGSSASGERRRPTPAKPASSASVRHTIEVSELSLERREHREARQTRSLVRLVDIKVAPDEPLDEWRRPVERPVTGYVPKTVMNLDELKVAGRNEWGGERKAEFVQATLDPAHREEPN
jgi:hypothetical protein